MPDRKTNAREVGIFDLPLAAATLAEAGKIAVIGTDGYARKGSADTGLRYAGMFLETVDNSTGLAAEKSARVRSDRQLQWRNSPGDPVTVADLWTPVYIEDDHTVSKTDGGGTRSMAGILVGVEGSGVWVLGIPQLPIAVPADGSVSTAKLGGAAVTGAKLHADAITPRVVTGADATGGAESLTATGMVATDRILAAINLTDSAVLNKAIFTPGTDSVSQASGNYDTKAILLLTVPAA